MAVAAKKPAKDSTSKSSGTSSSAGKSSKPSSAKTTASRAAARKPAKVIGAPARPAPAETSKEVAAHVDRVWELAERIGTAMLVTWDGERQRARPLAARVEKGEHAIHFLVDVNGVKDDQIRQFPIVTLAFADNAHSKYVVITGKAVVSNDRARIKDLWSPFAKAYWDSPDDPNIRIITVSPEDAELWDSPGRIVSTVAMLTAALTGGRPAVGENAKVAL